MELQLFSDQLGRDLRWKIFLSTDLGQLYQALPFEQLASLFPPPSKTGRPSLMDVKGGIALQVLKAYLNLSDEKLVARLNSDWGLQYFCGIRLGPGQWINAWLDLDPVLWLHSILFQDWHPISAQDNYVL